MTYHAHDLALGWLTLLDPDPFVTLRAAQAAGFGLIGIKIAPRPGEDIPLILTDQGRQNRFAKDLAASCLRLVTMGSLWLDGSVLPESYRPAIDYGRQLGARRVIAISTDPDPARRREHLGRLNAICAEVGMRMVIEFFAYSAIPTLEAAREDIRLGSLSGAGILFDALHFHRSGGSPDELTPDTVAEVDYYQLCDAPAQLQAGMTLAHEARAARLDPGEGGIDLSGQLSKLPKAILVEVEIPHPSQSRPDPEPRAREVLARSLRFLNGAG